MEKLDLKIPDQTEFDEETALDLRMLALEKALKERRDAGGGALDPVTMKDNGSYDSYGGDLCYKAKASTPDDEGLGQDGWDC